MGIYIYGCYECRKSFSVKKELDPPFRLCSSCRKAFIASLGLPPEWSSDDFLIDTNNAKPKKEEPTSKWMLELLNELSEDK